MSLKRSCVTFKRRKVVLFDIDGRRRGTGGVAVLGLLAVMNWGYSTYCVSVKATKAGNCVFCRDKYLKGSKVYKFAKIDPKGVTIKYAYAHLDCTDKRVARKETVELSEKKVLAFWDGVERLMNERQE
jgi:hypothetical protein